MTGGCRAAGSPSQRRSRPSWDSLSSMARMVEWCAVIALVGYLWSKRLFNRES
ncbi:hypothetical protein [Micromonospora sp. NPDC005305]|uniref:hypothetical protein n=1 Tax=Micromonospora sp. NPDC005305 TaxID=3156875 RepID=UPI0033B9511B